MNNKTIYALGFFDGVHLGHRALLQACLELARQQGSEAGVVTFGNHPDALVQGNQPALINTLADRRALLSQFQIDRVLELPFDEALRAMCWKDFLAMLQEQHDAVGFVCGQDFRFGHKGSGNAYLLAAYCRERGLPCAVVAEQKMGEITVSSTHIRQLLEAGDMEEAGKFLGHPHILTGQVISGRQLGRTLGIPTANLQLPEETVRLPFGVYACRATVEGSSYLAVTNIGNRPTVGGHRVTVEPWLLDFTGDLYGKTLTLQFYKFLRPERKFPSLEALQAEIQKNALETRAYFDRENDPFSRRIKEEKNHA